MRLGMQRVLHFTKMQGAGNDFMVIDRDAVRSHAEIFRVGQRRELIARMCDRHFGVGADGVILVSSCSPSGVTMEYYNSDGTPASFCGNGARCVARFAALRGWIGEEGTIHAPVGRVGCRVLPGGDVSIHMPDAHLPRYDAQLHGFILNTGVAHFVAEACFENGEDFRAWAEPLRWEVMRDDGGVNVNAYCYRGERIYLRTFERGVEAETLACGTGAVATALSIAFARGEEAGAYELHPRGGMLTVAFSMRPDMSGFENIWLSGEATRVAEGDFYLEDEQLND